MLGSYFYYHTTCKERNDGDLYNDTSGSDWLRRHSSGTATQTTMLIVGKKFGCGCNLDHFFPAPSGCFTIFTLSHCFLLKIQESLLTFSHFLHLSYCFGMFLQFTFFPNAKIIPRILLCFWNCTAAWIMSDAPAKGACLPQISPGGPA